MNIDKVFGILNLSTSGIQKPPPTLVVWEIIIGSHGKNNNSPKPALSQRFLFRITFRKAFLLPPKVSHIYIKCAGIISAKKYCV